jgi:universal stress protein A
MRQKFKRILWPTDFSPLSLAAADTARSLAQDSGAQLHVLHVAPLLVGDRTIAMETGGDLVVGPTDTRDFEERLGRLVSDYLHGQPVANQTVRVGTAWYEICNYAKETAIDLIVIATHGQTGLKHVLLGSVAERVVQHSHCSVLVVKSPDLAQVP